MCNGETGRESLGGTIAILKPATNSERPATLRRELSLRLVEDAKNGGTTAMIDGLGHDGFRDGHLIIHRDGDLTSQRPLDASSILHRFSVPGAAQDGLGFALATQLDLGVGGEGVIGRRVSLIQNHLLIGQGIIGWN